MWMPIHIKGKLISSFNSCENQFGSLKHFSQGFEFLDYVGGWIGWTTVSSPHTYQFYLGWAERHNFEVLLYTFVLVVWLGEPETTWIFRKMRKTQVSHSVIRLNLEKPFSFSRCDAVYGFSFKTILCHRWAPYTIPVFQRNE